MKKLFSHWLLPLLLTAAFAACSTMGVPSADTWNKRVYGAYKTVEASALVAVQLRTAGALSLEDRDNSVKLLNEAMQGIRLADAMHSSCLSAAASAQPPPSCDLAAQDKLAVSIAVLTEVQKYLAARQAATTSGAPKP